MSTCPLFIFKKKSDYRDFRLTRKFVTLKFIVFLVCIFKTEKKKAQRKLASHLELLVSFFFVVCMILSLIFLISLGEW